MNTVESDRLRHFVRDRSFGMGCEYLQNIKTPFRTVLQSKSDQNL
ncbi:hypothetical protein [Nostoc sp.]